MGFERATKKKKNTPGKHYFHSLNSSLQGWAFIRCHKKLFPSEQGTLDIVWEPTAQTVPAPPVAGRHWVPYRKLELDTAISFHREILQIISWMARTKHIPNICNPPAETSQLLGGGVTGQTERKGARNLFASGRNLSDRKEKKTLPNSQTAWCKIKMLPLIRHMKTRG